MRTDSGYELGVSTGLGENTIHPATLEGAGELRPEHGHKPLLMLVYLQQRFADDFSNVEKPLVAFCDEQGDTFDYERFDSLKPLIERFGFSYDEVRADAERLGLVSELIRPQRSTPNKRITFNPYGGLLPKGALALSK